LQKIKFNSIKSYSFLIRNNFLRNIKDIRLYYAIKLVSFIYVSLWNVAVWTVSPLLLLVMSEQLFPRWLSAFLLYVFIILLFVAVFESFRMLFISLRHTNLKQFDESILDYMRYVNDKLEYSLQYRRSGGISPLPFLSFASARVKMRNFLRSQSPDFRKRNLEYGFIYLYLLVSILIIYLQHDGNRSVYAVLDYTLYMLYQMLNTISFDIVEIFFYPPDIKLDRSQDMLLERFAQICFALGIAASVSRNIDIIFRRNIVLHTNFFGLKDYIENSYLSRNFIELYFLGVPRHYDFEGAKKIDASVVLLQLDKKSSELSSVNLKRIYKDKNFDSAWLQLQQAEFDALVFENISRNALCPCGSGKRYKHCHGSDVGL